MNKLCVVFPGRRYSCDRSLLYFPSQYIQNLGYEMKYLHYDVPKETHQMISLEENFVNAYQESQKELKGIDFSSYEEILFLGKSLGTIVSGKLRSELKREDIRLLALTPLPKTVPYLKDSDLIIAGDKDTYFPDEKAFFQGYSHAYFFPGLSHSMESKTDYHESLTVLKEVMKILEKYLSRN